jgi:gas vesicle protein
MLVGAVIGRTVGAVGSLLAAEEMDHPALIPPKKIA